jgi:hypothetical protein
LEVCLARLTNRWGYGEERSGNVQKKGQLP